VSDVASHNVISWYIASYRNKNVMPTAKIENRFKLSFQCTLFTNFKAHPRKSLHPQNLGIMQNEIGKGATSGLFPTGPNINKEVYI